MIVMAYEILAKPMKKGGKNILMSVDDIRDLNTTIHCLLQRGQDSSWKTC